MYYHVDARPLELNHLFLGSQALAENLFFEVCWVLADLFDGRTLPITSPKLLPDQFLLEPLRSGYLPATPLQFGQCRSFRIQVVMRMALDSSLEQHSHCAEILSERDVAATQTAQDIGDWDRVSSECGVLPFPPPQHHSPVKWSEMALRSSAVGPPQSGGYLDNGTTPVEKLPNPETPLGNAPQR